ncbi:DUF255 domain-containing protein [Paenibacillus alba]|uniref:DUF255 domain-containing protein n=1 Tax=Paenibacillus alba TaxID=1197127 RepID=UPI0015672691|nr:DUF255 domain-containing protein [Paenibacillus alba]NQX64746.1 DUF255 domain-containing protein [Paenibacillus alba]
MTTQKVPNRLAKEKSPYLLQHAYNLVDWLPWSEEAFMKIEASNYIIIVEGNYLNGKKRRD